MAALVPECANGRCMQIFRVGVADEKPRVLPACQNVIVWIGADSDPGQAAGQAAVRDRVVRMHGIDTDVSPSITRRSLFFLHSIRVS